MTRETKIGLLVGLAFIIVIGILLSDHLTSSTDPPAARLAPAGNSVRETVTTPGGSQPPVTPVTVAPQIAPDQTVLTQGDLDAQRKAQEIIKVTGPAVASSNTPSPSDSGNAITRFINSQPQGQPVTQSQRPPAVADSSTPTGVDPNLARIAAQHGEQLVSTPGAGNDRQANPGNRVDNSSAGAVEYTAQAGDSLSRIAAKLLGANTKANREAIVRANPSLQANPDKVIVGKTYRIPSAASVASTTPPATPASPTAPVIAAQQQNAAGEFWYTVKEGDTLTRIAREQLGLGDSAIPALVELNRDTIRNPDSLQINSRIRLPGKPVAQIN